MLNSASKLDKLRFANIIAALIMSMTLHSGGVAAADAVQARKDITAMGLEYNGQNFAKAAGNGDLVAVQPQPAIVRQIEGGRAAIACLEARPTEGLVILAPFPTGRRLEETSLAEVVVAAQSFLQVVQFQRSIFHVKINPVNFDALVLRG